MISHEKDPLYLEAMLALHTSLRDDRRQLRDVDQIVVAIDDLISVRLAIMMEEFTNRVLGPPEHNTDGKRDE